MSKRINQNRQAALAAGHSTYIGAPCIRKHEGLRYVSNGGCIECCGAAARQYRHRVTHQMYKPRGDHTALRNITRWNFSSSEQTIDDLREFAWGLIAARYPDLPPESYHAKWAPRFPLGDGRGLFRILVHPDDAPAIVEYARLLLQTVTT